MKYIFKVYDDSGRECDSVMYEGKDRKGNLRALANIIRYVLRKHAPLELQVVYL